MEEDFEDLTEEYLKILKKKNILKKNLKMQQQKKKNNNNKSIMIERTLSIEN